MKNSLKHFADMLVVTLSYIGVVVLPLTIILTILRVLNTGSGLFDLGIISVCLIMTFVCRVVAGEARRAHNKGERFLF